MSLRGNVESKYYKTAELNPLCIQLLLYGFGDLTQSKVLQVKSFLRPVWRLYHPTLGFCRFRSRKEGYRKGLKETSSLTRLGFGGLSGFSKSCKLIQTPTNFYTETNNVSIHNFIKYIPWGWEPSWGRRLKIKANLHYILIELMLNFSILLYCLGLIYVLLLGQLLVYILV